jgi:hypothetical protein
LKIIKKIISSALFLKSPLPRENIYFLSPLPLGETFTSYLLSPWGRHLLLISSPLGGED